MDTIYYLQLNDWSGAWYPQGTKIATLFESKVLLDDAWAKEHRICVKIFPTDMSRAYLITAPQSFIDEYMAGTDTSDTRYFKFPNSSGVVLNSFNDILYLAKTYSFLPYTEEHIGVTMVEIDPIQMEWFYCMRCNSHAVFIECTSKDYPRIPYFKKMKIDSDKCKLLDERYVKSHHLRVVTYPCLDRHVYLLTYPRRYVVRYMPEIFRYKYEKYISYMDEEDGMLPSPTISEHVDFKDMIPDTVGLTIAADPLTLQR